MSQNSIHQNGVSSMPNSENPPESPTLQDDSTSEQSTNDIFDTFMQALKSENPDFPAEIYEEPIEDCENDSVEEAGRKNSDVSERELMFHEFISVMINYSSIKQFDIAKELGINNANLISMYKQGRSKIPLNKIPKLAKILGIDQKFLVRKYLLEYEPEKLKIIESVFGASPITANEMEMIDEIRRITKNTDPKMRTIKQRNKLIDFSKSISLS